MSSDALDESQEEGSTPEPFELEDLTRSAMIELDKLIKEHNS